MLRQRLSTWKKTEKKHSHRQTCLLNIQKRTLKFWKLLYKRFKIIQFFFQPHFSDQLHWCALLMTTFHAVEKAACKLTRGVLLIQLPANCVQAKIYLSFD